MLMKKLCGGLGVLEPFVTTALSENDVRVRGQDSRDAREKHPARGNRELFDEGATCSLP